MKVVFYVMGNEGVAEYSNDQYSWSYEGDEQGIIDSLSSLDDGRMFMEIAGGEVVTDDGLTEVNSETFTLAPWDEQIKQLAEMIEDEGAEVIYLGE